MSIVFRQLLRRHLGFCALLFAITLPAIGQEENRKLVAQIMPAYPETLKRFNVSGVVKLQITISPNGSIKEMKTSGGNPVLVDLAMNAVRKWKYAPAPAETVTKVELTFKP